MKNFLVNAILLQCVARSHLSKSLHCIVSSSWTGIDSRLVDSELCQWMRLAMLLNVTTFAERWLDILLIRVHRHECILDDWLLRWNWRTFEFTAIGFWQFRLMCNELVGLNWR